ncbi:GAF and ANTAR domain-containing protein [Rhodococcus erythropolis]|uniref:GAF and ANTAR domain-containing protein n=1 Tax=Rhodococcus erythropolis TaxID=1833 RepID=UPI001BEC4585|nr:GAF and ANTAR domain-containing protein [Rhodococcus erythropolis]MBT2263511.1 GAF and ANTAR domain-containing protein [Rhodococcus erythropolis]
MEASEGSTPDIFERISHLARTAHGTLTGGVKSSPDVLEEVTEGAVKLLDGVDHAVITLVRRSRPGHLPDNLESVAATGTVPRRFDELQYQHGEGPCFDAIWLHQTVRITDVGVEARWPRLMAAVQEQTPVRSTLSIQLYTDGQELGSLNLFSDSAGGFDDDTEEEAINLATHAAIALSSARRGEQFRSALGSRDLIGQAKGMIMERFDLDAVAAFNLLRKLSQEMNVPIVDVSRRLASREMTSRGKN